MIPKIVHYCWFGSSKKPRAVRKYLRNWKKMLPDYQLMEWNEENCDVEEENDYVKEAYRSGKFAFVSDYFRVKRLFEYGGIYLDTDVEVIKGFDEKLQQKVVLGFQGTGNVLTAFMACEPGQQLFGEFLNEYQSRHFIREDGTYDMTSINRKMDPLLVEYGIDLEHDEYQETDQIVIYPTAVFCGFDMKNWHPKITAETCLVHHMASSWLTKSKRMKNQLIQRSAKLIGYERFDKLKQRLKK